MQLKTLPGDQMLAVTDKAIKSADNVLLVEVSAKTPTERKGRFDDTVWLVRDITRQQKDAFLCQ